MIPPADDDSFDISSFLVSTMGIYASSQGEDKGLSLLQVMTFKTEVIAVIR